MSKIGCTHQKTLVVDNFKAFFFLFQIGFFDGLVPTVLLHSWLTFLYRNGFQHKLAVEVRYQVTLLIGDLYRDIERRQQRVGDLIFYNFRHFMAVLGDDRVATRWGWGRDVTSPSSKCRKVGVG